MLEAHESTADHLPGDIRYAPAQLRQLEPLAVRDGTALRGEVVQAEDSRPGNPVGRGGE
jgi:hypothetical protein